MSLLKPLARILGPKGLMPTAKLKTLVPVSALKDTISTARTSLVDFRQVFYANETYRIVHNVRLNIIIGKRSYPFDTLYTNFKHLVVAINAKKPEAIKKNFIAHAHICSNHGPARQIHPSFVNRTSGNYEFKGQQV